MLRTGLARGLAALALSVMAAGAGLAQEVTLRMHQMLPPQASVPRDVLAVWADQVEADSGGRIKVEQYDAMALGGTPPQLIDQAIDGVADVIWTVVGYTPGRFPSTEVFELPFMVEDPRAATSAYWQMFEESMADTEFEDVHMIGVWVHGPGMFHTKEPVLTPDDLQGMKIRGGSRLVNQLLELAGATPVGMPVPAVAEALSKGVIDGTTIPWEVTPSLKVPELVSHHTEFEGPALYTLTFVMAMNKDRYESLPDDLKAVIDKHSGHDFSVWAGGVMADADIPARQIAVDRSNTIHIVSEEDAKVWRDKVEPIYDSWKAEMAERGIDGQALIDRARELMDAYQG